MADPTLVNGQITDAVTQTNVKVLAEAPAMAMGSLYQVAAQSLSVAMQNAVTAQQNGNVLAQAATTMGVTMLYSMDTAADTVVFDGDSEATATEKDDD